MSISALPDTLAFSLKERIEARKHIPTMEELAKEAELRKKEERNKSLGIWSFDRKRAYPEYDHFRTGEVSIEIADQYVGGCRRRWKDGLRQRLEGLIEDIAGGIATYLVGVKTRREEHERWQLEWQRKEKRRALAAVREQRETRRREFLQRYVVISNEADQLRALLTRLRTKMPSSPSNDLSRMTEWAEARLQRLEDELSPDAISNELRERGLFPEIDDLCASGQGENDISPQD